MMLLLLLVPVISVSWNSSFCLIRPAPKQRVQPQSVIMTMIMRIYNPWFLLYGIIHSIAKSGVIISTLICVLMILQMTCGLSFLPVYKATDECVPLKTRQKSDRKSGKVRRYPHHIRHALSKKHSWWKLIRRLSHFKTRVITAVRLICAKKN